jgi:hypothetical protein
MARVTKAYRHHKQKICFSAAILRIHGRISATFGEENFGFHVRDAVHPMELAVSGFDVLAEVIENKFWCVLLQVYEPR